MDPAELDELRSEFISLVQRSPGGSDPSAGSDGAPGARESPRSSDGAATPEHPSAGLIVRITGIGSFSNGQIFTAFRRTFSAVPTPTFASI